MHNSLPHNWKGCSGEETPWGENHTTQCTTGLPAAAPRRARRRARALAANHLLFAAGVSLILLPTVPIGWWKPGVGGGDPTEVKAVGRGEIGAS